MPTINLMAMRAQVAGFIGDHVYLEASTGLSWCCYGRNSGGNQHAKVKVPDLRSCICLALPDQGPQANQQSIGNPNAGILFSFTGVCHQIANRVLVGTGMTVAGVRGYNSSFALFGPYGVGNWPERGQCPQLRMRPSSTVSGRTSARTPSRRMTLTRQTDEPTLGNFAEEIHVDEASELGRGQKPRVKEAYSRFGYGSEEARAAEIESLVDDLGGALSAEERRRVVEEHHRLHSAQAQLLDQIDAGELQPNVGLNALTEKRILFFRRCADVLGDERFALLFGDNLDALVDQVTALPEVGDR